MPHYYFDVKNGHRLIDPVGLECRDDRDAITKATFIAAQIAMDVPNTSGGRGVAVLNSAREEIIIALTVYSSLPVCPDKQTSSAAGGTSQRCQLRTWPCTAPTD
jgi:uncharacterized protein DUF6894